MNNSHECGCSPTVRIIGSDGLCKNCKGVSWPKPPAKTHLTPSQWEEIHGALNDDSPVWVYKIIAIGQLVGWYAKDYKYVKEYIRGGEGVVVIADPRLPRPADDWRPE